MKVSVLPNKMQEKLCGILIHSRWLTTAQRLLFLWTRQHGLNGHNLKVLELLVKFCLEYYFKIYFDLKVKHDLVDAPYHILTQLRILKTQPKQGLGMHIMNVYSSLFQLAQTAKTETLQ